MTTRNSKPADARHPSLCVLLIHHNAGTRGKLERCLERSAWKFFHAQDRAEALPLMYQVHPDLIFLELDLTEKKSWDTFFAIRFFTDNPVILISDGGATGPFTPTDDPVSPTDDPVSPTNALLVFEPIQAEMVNAIVHALPASAFDSRSAPVVKRPGRQS